MFQLTLRLSLIFALVHNNDSSGDRLHSWRIVFLSAGSLFQLPLSLEKPLRKKQWSHTSPAVPVLAAGPQLKENVPQFLCRGRNCSFCSCCFNTMGRNVTSRSSLKSFWLSKPKRALWSAWYDLTALFLIATLLGMLHHASNVLGFNWPHCLVILVYCNCSFYWHSQQGLPAMGVDFPSCDMERQKGILFLPLPFHVCTWKGRKVQKQNTYHHV